MINLLPLLLCLPESEPARPNRTRGVLSFERNDPEISITRYFYAPPIVHQVSRAYEVQERAASASRAVPAKTLRRRAKKAAQERLRRGEYVPWAKAGGPDECIHGWAASLACPDCDRRMVGKTDPSRIDQGRNRDGRAWR